MTLEENRGVTASRELQQNPLRALAELEPRVEPLRSMIGKYAFESYVKKSTVGVSGSSTPSWLQERRRSGRA